MSPQKINIRLFFLILIFCSSLFSQRFGKNPIQYDVKDWRYIQSEHFDIYYYKGGKRLAVFAASVAESSYVNLSNTFDYQLIARIPILIYRSHNDFSETNLSPGIVGESVGGFTEFLKDRVVLPFQGSYEQFRHVIHHELTHAVMLQFLYGTGPGSIIQGVQRARPPLWFIEGLAEFESIGWDTESDMYARDATVRGMLPPIPYLRGYLAYKGGQSVWRYIDETYGSQKRTEILQRYRTTKDFKNTWQQSLNESLEKTTEKWQNWMREKYWPQIEGRKDPSEFATAITHHREWQNFVNNSPAVSPDGGQVVFLSDRSGYFDIYLASTTNPEDMRKIIKGQRQANLEELNWLRPGISWSNDGRKIAFSARSKGQDAIHIYDIEKEKIVNSFKFKLDGLFGPMWSPVSDEIAFVGMKSGASDIYVYHIGDDSLRAITNDIFSDLQPAWSADGRTIAFVSDRKSNVEPAVLRDSLDIEEYDYHTTDVYTIPAKGGAIRRITSSEFNEISPQWTPKGDSLLYISDQSGIDNIYVRDLKTGNETPITDLLTGCAQLSFGIRSKRLAFTAYSHGGYDIYLWIDPLAETDTTINLVRTKFIKKVDAPRLPSHEELPGESERLVEQVKQQQNYSNYVFGDDFRAGRVGIPVEKQQKAKIPEEKRKKDGDYVVNDYSTNFSVDYINANAGYNSFYGVTGFTNIYLSDITGNHSIVVALNIIRNLRNSDAILSYQNLKRRFDWNISAHQIVNFFSSNLGIVRFANRGAGAQLSYPVTRYKRFDVGLSYLNILMENLTFPQLPTRNVNLLMPSISFTHDNSIWKYYSPGNGSRGYIRLSGSPELGEDGRQFLTTQMDVRKYISLGRDYTLALRVAGGASFGKDPTLFVMGGVKNWFNRIFDRDISYLGIEDYFLANFMMPLRGADLYQMVGTRAGLFNMEFRFPFIQQIVTRFPVRLGFQRIRGVAFLDAGSAWSDDEAWRFADTKPDGDVYVSDVFTGFGYGLRINVYYFLLRFDAAWHTDFDKVSKPRYYWSLGFDF